MNAQTVKVWDPFIRIFHWSLVFGLLLNGLILDDDGKLHNQVGYVVTTLVLLRLIWGLIGTRHARFSDFPPSLTDAMEQAQDISVGRRRLHLGHSPLGALMIYNLLAAIVLLGVTGYMMGTNAFFGIEWVEEVHEFLAAWMGVSVTLHVCAVLYESLRTGVNLPRAMVTGRKTIPNWSAADRD
jgi:cytochrome b